MSHSVAVDVSTLSPEIIAALQDAGALTEAQVTALAKAGVETGVVGDAHVEVVADPEAEDEGYASVTGYVCKTKRGARWASEWVIRHWQGECKCDPIAKPKPWRCRAVKRYGQDYMTLGVDPEATMPDHLLD